jgi:hypothetical protein
VLAFDLGAQSAGRPLVIGARHVGSVEEEYQSLLARLSTRETPDALLRSPIRSLHTMGAAEAAHPWRGQLARVDSQTFTGHRRPLQLGVTVSSSLPVQLATGPVWVGRGLTASVRGGGTVRLGRLFVQLEPIVWASQNSAFDLSPNGYTDARRFNDARFPLNIDLPQRMGAAPVTRVNPGNSSAAIPIGTFAAGISTAARAWGMPGSYPLMLGPSAGGFPHAFLETLDALPTPVGRFEAQLVLGRAGDSPFAPTDADSTRRTVAGLAVAFRPRGIPGVEVGAARFLHTYASRTIPSPRVLGRLFSSGLTGTGTDGLADVNRRDENHLASVFFRWVPSGGRLTVGGEYLWDDYANDLRDLLLYPDDLRTFSLHASLVTGVDARRLSLWDAELVNSELPWSNERRGRTGGTTPGVPFPPYLHGSVRQGHAHLGLPLGSRAAYGGAAARLSYRRFSPNGLTGYFAERQMMQDWRRGTRGDSLPSRHIRYSGGITRSARRGSFEPSFTAALLYDLNVNLDAGRDLVHVLLSTTVTRWR